MGTFTASGETFTATGRFFSFLRSYSFFILLLLLPASFSGANDTNSFAFFSFAENDQQDFQARRYPDPKKPFLVHAMLRVEKFPRTGVGPYCLGFFKPNPVLFKIGP